MSSASKESELDKLNKFVIAWNGLLDYKIDEQNLRKPNFNFMYNALESLLRKLNFNIELAKERAKTQNDPDRAYYIMFCAFVQRLVNLSDPTHNFHYFDLINPSKSFFTFSHSFHIILCLTQIYSSFVLSFPT